jgi:hypothetical protein
MYGVVVIEIQLDRNAVIRLLAGVRAPEFVHGVVAESKPFRRFSMLLPVLPFGGI